MHAALIQSQAIGSVALLSWPPASGMALSNVHDGRLQGGPCFDSTRGFCAVHASGMRPQGIRTCAAAWKCERPVAWNNVPLN